MGTPPTSHSALEVPRTGPCRIPTVTTQRLILRSFTTDDLDAYAELTADEQTMRYLGEGGPLDRAGTWRVLAVILGHWHLRGYGIWAMADRATQRLIGRAGLYYPEGWPALEVVWSVARDRWGQGLATEAGQAALDYAFEQLSADHVISTIHPRNHASIRVAEKLGQTFEYGPTNLQGRERMVYGITRSTWLRSRP